ncbi:MAG: type II secretion system F family protein [Dethiobacter sp.]|jgi:tight adherence protein C|nr:type II secretion system F family protein [Dethiobacter sp.]
MFDLIILFYGFMLAAFTFSFVSYKLKIPGKAPMVLVRRIENINLSEKELDEKFKPLHEKLLQPIARAIVRGVKLNRLTRMELEEKLVMAGMNRTPEEFMVKQLTTGLGIFVLSLVWVFILRSPVVLLPGLLLGLLGAALPAGELDKKIQEKKELIIMELPDFLDMLVLSLRAGRNLYSAIKKAAEHSGQALRPLLEKLQADVELVENKKDALWDFAERTGIQEVRDFVSALEIGMDAKAKQAEEIYRNQSKIMRELRVMALRRYTKSIPSKLSLLHIWLYLNCIAIPIIGAIVQFGNLMSM